MLKCYKCGREVVEGSRYCTYCGAPVREVSQMAVRRSSRPVCSGCGAPRNPEDAFCIRCGKPRPLGGIKAVAVISIIIGAYSLFLGGGISFVAYGAGGILGWAGMLLPLGFLLSGAGLLASRKPWSWVLSMIVWWGAVAIAIWLMISSAIQATPYGYDLGSTIAYTSLFLIVPVVIIAYLVYASRYFGVALKKLEIRATT